MPDWWQLKIEINIDDEEKSNGNGVRIEMCPTIITWKCRIHRFEWFACLCALSSFFYHFIHLLRSFVTLFFVAVAVCCCFVFLSSFLLRSLLILIFTSLLLMPILFLGTLCYSIERTLTLSLNLPMFKLNGELCKLFGLMRKKKNKYNTTNKWDQNSIRSKIEHCETLVLLQIRSINTHWLDADE